MLTELGKFEAFELEKAAPIELGKTVLTKLRNAVLTEVEISVASALEKVVLSELGKAVLNELGKTADYTAKGCACSVVETPRDVRDDGGARRLVPSQPRTPPAARTQQLTSRLQPRSLSVSDQCKNYVTGRRGKAVLFSQRAGKNKQSRKAFSVPK